MKKDNEAHQRLRCLIRGAVQGVGFRPFVYRLASELMLHGWVSNSPGGVVTEVEGSRDKLDEFVRRLHCDKPPHSFIHGIEVSLLDPTGCTDFTICKSNSSGAIETVVQADIATCPECIAELFDPTNRRYLYPFINCTHCGPRYSIIESLPYDRVNTTMKHFQMCDACRCEYEDPLDRRFHAQPNACPQCGPHVQWWMNGAMQAERHAAIMHAVETIRAGQILALKGIGGFHLLVDARNDDAVTRLRQRKHREAKPLALIFPTLEMIRQECEVSEMEARLLSSPESPIVLLKRQSSSSPSSIARGVAPNNPYLGVMLPYSPLHHILLRALGAPIVATSGNLSDEPICIDEHEAFTRLDGIADSFLVHNRPIKRHVDDSVARIVLGHEQVLRRARGYAPLPIAIHNTCATSMLAVGAHQKNAVALAHRGQIFISQHIGDLETPQAVDAFQHVVGSLQHLYGVAVETGVADLHPDYGSTQFAKRAFATLHQVQHHHAHAVACMAENDLDGEVLAVSWDGTGYGEDGIIWGGEFLRADRASFQRVATLREFSLPGSARAVKEPRRTALGLLYEIFGEAVFEIDVLAPVASFTRTERTILRRMLSKKINSPPTTSVGRLFDAVASIVDLRQRVCFEGQAAMELEFAIDRAASRRVYDFHIEQTTEREKPGLVVDWSALISSIVRDVLSGQQLSTIATRFHDTLVEIIVAVAKRMGLPRVVLTGGCFQNRYLTEQAMKRLEENRFSPYIHQRVPPNDGGIAFGQLVVAMSKEEHLRESLRAGRLVQPAQILQVAE